MNRPRLGFYVVAVLLGGYAFLGYIFTAGALHEPNNNFADADIRFALLVVTSFAFAALASLAGASILPAEANLKSKAIALGLPIVSGAGAFLGVLLVQSTFERIVKDSENSLAAGVAVPVLVGPAVLLFVSAWWVKRQIVQK